MTARLRVPLSVAKTLKAQYEAKMLTDAMYQQTSNVVGQMLGIAEGREFAINFETGVVTLIESPMSS